ncbi:hypothetical protein J7E97_29910 [Streptomyces sp. ISL-66]|uniref:hypothetical protein n=1 Tax=Streptomyces sp. ISL-66 TaxID=2819186 RepID=UPI001BEC16AB|nr:hypothetical protein [Streptomyces sp. ISL-66]MBT2471962.1 hypothetical protein [Streptomyces sp. ISL-66]
MSGLRAGLGAVRRRLLKLNAARRAWRLMVPVLVPRRAKRSALLLYAAVLDGQTVNLHAELPVTAGIPDSAEIVLGSGRNRYAVPARIRTDRDGRVLVDAAVLLGAEMGGAPVTPGRWKLRLRTRAGRSSRNLPLMLSGPPSVYEGGATGPMAFSPVTGRRHRIVRSATGEARIICSAPKPGVEVVHLHIGHSGIQVDFRVLGIKAEDAWCEFAASGRRITAWPAETEPGVWRVGVPLSEMTPAGHRNEHWDMLFCSEGRRSVRVARKLHDVRDPQRVFAARRIVVAPGPENLIMVESRYTAAGNLRFTCSTAAG